VEEILDHNGEVVDEAKVRMKKTGGVANFPISDRTKVAVKKWLETRERQSKWLFYGRPPYKPMTEVRYRQLSKVWFGAAGLDIRLYSTHSLRRTKATIMYDETNDIKAVSEMLGHSNVTMTEKYIGMTRKKAVALARTIDV
jgi:integrase